MTKWSEINKGIYEREGSWGSRSETHFHERYYRKLIKNFFGFSPSFKVLDLGCGDAFYFGWFATVADAFGQDIASEYVESHLPPTLVTRFRAGDATQIQFPDNYFDGVFLNHVIEHVDKTQARTVLAEIRRVLKPSGKLFVATPNRFGLAELFLDITFRSRRRAATGHANIMTPKELGALLVESGFQVRQILSRSVLCYPSGLDIPIIGHYMSGYPILAALARASEGVATKIMGWDLQMTSRWPFLLLGFDIIALSVVTKDR